MPGAVNNEEDEGFDDEHLLFFCLGAEGFITNLHILYIKRAQ